MNCAYHSQNMAVVQCNNCARALCPACDHRIKGFPYCQDCIVAGIGLLRDQRSLISNRLGVARRSSPFLAVLLSFVCPGLGAAYNGQNSKALAHFGVFVGLFQMAVLTVTPLFVLGFIGMWLFTAVDAFRTARAIKHGSAPESDDFLTKQLAGNPLVWAVSLIGLGSLFFANTFLNFSLPMIKILPILLVALGVYWLINYVHQKRHSALHASAPPTSLSAVGETNYDANNVSPFRSGKY